MRSTIIILNGVSSAGKSSLARAIQQAANTTFLHVEMDAFLSFLPPGHEFRPDWFTVRKVEVAGTILPRISNGPRGETLLGVMRRFVIEAGRKGLDMVVDEVCHAKEINEYRAGLSGCQVQVVKVFAPIDVIEEREKARGDRMIGLAREQSSHLHNGIAYDVAVDTNSASHQTLAEIILGQLEN